ncbi:MAG: hypothetical protein ACI808_000188 [Paraglaciecola sp.]|jgi:hypothetical protein
MKVSLVDPKHEAKFLLSLSQFVVQLSKLIVVINILLQAYYYVADMATMPMILNFHPTAKIIFGLSLFMAPALIISVYTGRAGRNTNRLILLFFTISACLLHLLNVHGLFPNHMGLTGIKWWVVLAIFTLFAVKSLEGLTLWINCLSSKECIYEPSSEVKKVVRLYWRAFFIILTSLLLFDVY